MITISLCLLVLALLLLGAIALLGRSHVLMANHGPRPADHPAFASLDGRWPPIGLVIPMHGDRPTMREAVASMLDQDYPELTVVLVTAEEDDPATNIARGHAASRGNVHHVIAGEAETNAQKLHNQLAGIALLEELDSPPEILAFSDSTHLAPQGHLRELILPLVKADAFAVTGYHRVAPQDIRLTTLMYAFAVLGLHLMQGIPLLSQSWGGAMALARRTYHQHGVGELWRTNIVDDVSLTVLANKLGRRVTNASRACLVSPARDTTLDFWIAWLTRQVLYLRFCMPGTWLAAALGFLLLAAPPFIAVGLVIASLVGLVCSGAGFAGVGFLVIGGTLILSTRSLIPENPPILRWLMAGAATLVLAAWCYLRTWTARRMVWGIKAYAVGRGGKVKRVETIR
ncbi:glycosyl transferase [Oceanidesulfovibrio indonesiensis]|uniref:Glycosyl transferase n=1 Tax=Oceanidesulfovibrio indonesiensis TaxID=54767 RepID=A0A7M3MDI9_9BACT|nr:glycosyltransferase family 2 protein [Oceanidesulfovibrio indonesiensis]TVM16673.1 glycosyl transferase [Oceanidesulfovibrio indonesiensis]